MAAMSDLNDEELRKLAATHRLAAEEYERQLALNETARVPEEIALLKRALGDAKIRISELEKIIYQTRVAVSGHYDSEDGHYYSEDDE